VIAVGGDSIEATNQVIYVNGRKLDEPYVEHIGEAPEWANTFGPVYVPTGNFFVMGDNRDYSLDSRSEEYGLVDQRSIVGKPLYTFDSDRTGQSIH
jgi:signal peptidase I